MASNKLIVLDFDRTIFNVHDFFIDFCQMIAGDKLLKNNALKQSVEEFLRLEDPTSMAIGPFIERFHVDLQGVYKKVAKVLSKNGYLYQDVAPFIERMKSEKVMILTTGQFEFQMSKLEIVPEVAGLNKKVITGAKGEFINNHIDLVQGGVIIEPLAGKEVFSQLYLIDDNVEVLMPLIGRSKIKLYHIQRSDAKFRRDKDYRGMTHIESLEEVK